MYVQHQHSIYATFLFADTANEIANLNIFQSHITSMDNLEVNKEPSWLASFRAEADDLMSRMDKCKH